ncbi:amino acid ABC transporter permease [Gemmobacter sp.]|uniref:amino acid ABC transporter permease n=1 Tax=Gemmobacter sp. TaxID=1898957 RepID=UPI002AFF10CA|nr:amino acid ABC transporter permease [Gemmobacter sp.]
MTRVIAEVIQPPRPAPDRRPGAWDRARDGLFWSPGATLVTLALGAALLALAWVFLRWALVGAVWPAGLPADQASAACRAATGACWAMVDEKARLILFGVYPYAEQWRAAIAAGLMVALYALSLWPRCWRPWLGLVWLGVLVAVVVLMRGGLFGLRHVPDSDWGGLPVTLILATFGLALAFPLAVLLALARQATGRPVIRTLAVVFIEFARGVPLLVVLFMASVMFPLFLPPGVEISKLLRVLVAFTLFAAAYLAEVIRGGLQGIPQGQYEAARALALGYWRSTAWVILPQALRLVIPAIVNVFIGFFKATSIVAVVGIIDLLTSSKRAVSDPLWQGFEFEVYLVSGLIYFAFCYAMSRASQRLERDLARDRHR